MRVAVASIPTPILDKHLLVIRWLSRGVEHGEESRGSPKPPSMPPKDRTPPISAPKDPTGDKE